MSSVSGLLVENNFPVKFSGLVTPDSVTTFTNKTITDSSNDVAANSLNTATSVVNVSNAPKPNLPGQALVANDTGDAATWQSVLFPGQQRVRASATNNAGALTPILEKLLSTDPVANKIYTYNLAVSSFLQGDFTSNTESYQIYGQFRLSSAGTISEITQLNERAFAGGDNIVVNSSGPTIQILASNAAIKVWLMYLDVQFQAFA